jgi:hypothetical protein
MKHNVYFVVLMLIFSLSYSILLNKEKETLLTEDCGERLSDQELVKAVEDTKILSITNSGVFILFFLSKI